MPTAGSSPSAILGSAAPVTVTGLNSSTSVGNDVTGLVLSPPAKAMIAAITTTKVSAAPTPIHKVLAGFFLWGVLVVGEATVTPWVWLEMERW